MPSPTNKDKGRIIIIRHGDDPPDDRVYTHLVMGGFICQIVKPFAGENLPDWQDDIVGSVIHGGKFNAYDHKNHPFMADEDRWIEECLDRDIPLLGICQGAQQIAYHLGAKVGPLSGEPCEFGYETVSPTREGKDFLPEPLHVTQAHFHTFDIPQGAVHLARSTTFENQAFSYGDKVFGMQFHPEVTIEGFRRWQEKFTYFSIEQGAQSREQQTLLGMKHDHAQAQWFYQFLEKLF